MAFNVVLILRGLQLFFAVIVLGIMSYVASLFPSSVCPSQVAFMIFCAVWTIVIAVPYLTLGARYWPSASHKFITLGVEALTMLFWFAGFIALAVFVSDFFGFCVPKLCDSSKAGSAFGGFEWLLFAATTVMATIHVVRTRHEGVPTSMRTKNFQQQYVHSTSGDTA